MESLRSAIGARNDDHLSASPSMIVSGVRGLFEESRNSTIEGVTAVLTKFSPSAPSNPRAR